MKHIKLFEQFINEAKVSLDKLVKMIGTKPSIYDLANFIYKNYDKVTGLRKSMRDDEMDFPSEIEDLVNHYGFDIVDFTDNYGMVAESLVKENSLKLYAYNESVINELKVGKEDFSFLLKLTDKELVKRLDLIRKQQLINGKQYMDARSKGEDTSKIEKVGENLANQEKAVIHARIRIKESV